jgi:competence protein ComEC
MSSFWPKSLLQQAWQKAWMACVRFQAFWQTYPALWYALFFYAGAVCALAPAFSLFLLLFFLLIPSCTGGQSHRKRILYALLSFFVSYAYVSSSVILPPQRVTETSGMAECHVTNIATKYQYAKAFYKLDLLITHFQSDSGGITVQNLPCRLTIEASSFRPRAGREYEVHGKLIQRGTMWFFSPTKPQKWLEKQNFFSLVEHRYALKQKLVMLLSKHFPQTSVRSFLEGVLVGQFHDVQLKASLKRFGLQHILVVSGFHFALLVLILSSCIRLFTRAKVANILLTVAITLYFLFIGSSASVFRAYIAASACICAKFLTKESSGINALGIGLLFVVIFEPLWCLEVGFQLSFLATWAILLLFTQITRYLFSFWPKYSLQALSEARFVEQVVFVLSTYFLSALALILSVTLLCFPMTLFAFNQFPLWGIFYNLFFPFGVSLALFCVLLGLCFLPIAAIGALFLSLGGYILEALLTLVMHAPTSLDVGISCSCISVEFLTFYLLAVSIIGIVCTEKYYESFTVISSTQNL